MSNIIFCFSGTGNSLNAAKIISARLDGCEIVSMGRKYAISGEYERIGFVFPCYVCDIPKPARRFIQSLDLAASKNAYCFAVVTCGAQGGNCLKHVGQILDEKGLLLAYGKSIKMVSNAITAYGMPKNTEGITAKTNRELAVLADEIASKTATQIPKINPIWTFAHKKRADAFDNISNGYKINDGCSSCGACARLCPVGNIEMDSGKLRFGEKCVGCMACIQWCPSTAIDYRQKTQGKRRYHHPDLSIGEMAGFNDVAFRENNLNGKPSRGVPNDQGGEKS